ncbi:Ribonuclease H2 subunit B [Theobroma cacao]|uniref:Ribonuclease H2 subunit B n=1 Tax=Theobroma cacao TaxID=3641 RepID=A0AB32VEV7_THECC|nr:PREDICTED: ribonuclease H2 subunit B isoform X2 [Theobroma cacao]WRX18199.1 Ribonuclease H2 subunit B [Theobroma cacao]
MGCWWEGVDESRLLIAPDPGSNGDGSARLISLRHPKSGVTTSYLLSNRLLQELHWFKQSYGSWFLGDYVSEDGSLYTATPIDPVFIMLPIFEEARMKKVDDPGKFRQLDEILFINDYPGYRHLFSIAENCMQVVCEIKEIGSSKFFRLDDTKVLAWLNYKVCQLKQTLPALDQNYAARDEKDTLADAISIIGEYLKHEPWLKLLSNHFKLNLLEATRIASDFEACSNAIESPMGASNPSQGKTRGEKKTARNQKQAKKAKIETESRNIKEMFSRASRRRN